MAEKLKLFMMLLGCKPSGRFIEQHDIFFGIGRTLEELVPLINSFWPEANGKIHIDVWREVSAVNGYRIDIVPKEDAANNNKLFFINLGGYKKSEFEEYHYRMLAAAVNITDAVTVAKQSAFYKHTGFTGAVTHVDDKFGIDADDIYNVADMLGNAPQPVSINITKAEGIPEDELHIGYLPLTKIHDSAPKKKPLTMRDFS